MRSAVFAVISCLMATTAVAQERWAAQVPYTGGSGPVAFADSKDLATKRALAACRKRHDTCATSPASVLVSDYSLFVTTCCRVNGDDRCHIQATPKGGDEGRRDAYRASIRAFENNGLPTGECWREGVYSVRTGDRLD